MDKCINVVQMQLMSENKTQPKNLRFPSGVADKIQSMAKWFEDNGLMSRANFTETLLIILKQADEAGLMETPPSWLEYRKPKRVKKK